jgi:hypothetical protein
VPPHARNPLKRSFSQHRPRNVARARPEELIPPLHDALIKNEQDVHLFERFAFLARRKGR